MAIASLARSEHVLGELQQALATLKGTRHDDPFWQAVILVDCDGTAPKVRSLETLKEVEVNLPSLSRFTDARFRELDQDA